MSRSTPIDLSLISTSVSATTSLTYTRTVPANFYLNGLATSVSASETLAFNLSPPDTTVAPGIAATISVSATEFENVFQFGLNQSFTDSSNSSTEISNMLFQTNLTNASGKYWLAGDSTVDITTATIDSSSDTYGNLANGTQTLGAHFIKYIASELFGTFEGDVLFNNQQTFTSQLSTDIKQGLSDVITGEPTTGVFVPTDTIDASNFAGKMFETAVSADPAWLSNLPSMSASSQVVSAGATYDMYNLPLITGDKIYFNLCLTPKLDQNSLTGVPQLLSKFYVVCVEINS
jgi:hypothetical protein